MSLMHSSKTKTIGCHKLISTEDQKLDMIRNESEINKIWPQNQNSLDQGNTNISPYSGGGLVQLDKQFGVLLFYLLVVLTSQGLDL